MVKRMTNREARKETRAIWVIIMLVMIAMALLGWQYLAP